MTQTVVASSILYTTSISGIVFESSLGDFCLGHGLATAVYAPLARAALGAVHGRTFLCLADISLVRLATPQISARIT